MLQASRFLNAEKGDPFDKAMDRARRVKPEVYFMFSDAVASKTYFLVKRTDKISDYVVRVWIDPDGERYVECECHNGRPPLDARTKLPAFDPAPCTHASALVLFTEKENQ